MRPRRVRPTTLPFCPARLARIALTVCCLLWAASPASAWRHDQKGRWPDGLLRLEINLAGAPAVLSDGRTPDEVIAHAATTWNSFLGRLQFEPILGSTAPVSTNWSNGFNNVAFATRAYGQDLGPDVLAVTFVHSDTQRREVDVFFAANVNWDSHRGPRRTGAGASFDLLRVALHELGYVLGLQGPSGAQVALIDQRYGDLDSLQDDDKDGVAELYGPGPGYMPPPPQILRQPQSFSAEAGLHVSLSIDAPRASRFQWKRDGVVLAGRTDPALGFENLSFNDAGFYSCDVSNVGGTTSSEAAQITVLPTRPPRFIFYPENQELQVGQAFDFAVTVFGSGPITYQWYLDGTLLPGVVHNRHTGIVSAISGGRYEIVATNRAGETTTHAFVLTARPPERVVVNDFTSVRTSLGQSFTFFTGQAGAAGLAFQWFKDGAAIPGATSRTYSRPAATEADYGEYVLVVTNEAGASASTTVRLDPEAPVSAASAWRQAVRDGTVEYFLFDTPARVERYDRADRRWLAPWSLPAAGTSLAVRPEAAFVTVGHQILRFPHDGGASSTLVSLPAQLTDLLAAGDWLVVKGTVGSEVTLRAIHPATGAIAGRHSSSTTLYGAFSYAPSLRAIFGSSQSLPTRVQRLDLTADGQFVVGPEPAYDSDAPASVRGTWVLSGEQLVADDTGRVYDTTGVNYARFIGAFDDLVPLADGGLGLLRAGVVRVLDAAWQEQGRFLVPGSQPSRLALHEGRVAAFTPAAGTNGVNVAWLDLALARPPPAAAARLPGQRSMLVSATAMDREGNVLVLAKTERNLHRWSTHVRAWLPASGLRGAPNLMAYSAARHGVYLAYAGGVVTFLDLATGEERAFTQLKDEPGTMLVAGDHLVVAGGWFYRARVFDATGRETGGSEVRSLRLAWLPVSRQLLVLDLAPHHSVLALGTDGSLGSPTNLYITESSGAPLALDPSGARLLTTQGHLLDIGLQTGTLHLGRTLVGAGWMGAHLAALSATFTGAQLDSYLPPAAAVGASRQLTGRPLAFFGLEADRALGVLDVDGHPVFRFFDLALENATGRAVPSPSRLINLSARAWVGSGDQQVIPGFVISGSGTKRVLVRAVGPSLEPAGIAGFLTNPRLELFNGGGSRLAQNDDWNDLPDLAAFLDRGAAVGANPFATGSRDAGLLEAVVPGSYSAHTSGLAGGTGVSVIEVFDGDPADPSARLVNLSARARVGTGDDVLIAGFVIRGEVPKRLLVHGLGPQLEKVVPGALTNPSLTLHGRRGEVLLSNDDWVDTPELRTAWTQTGATSLATGSRDAVLLVALSPGLYSAVLRGDSAATGIGMIELYEVPE